MHGKSHLCFRFWYTKNKDNKDYGCTDQICRAAVSVINNIAEGFDRSRNQDFKRSLYISKSSVLEVHSMLYLARELGYINNQDFIYLRKLSLEVSGIISVLSKNFKLFDMNFHIITLFPESISGYINHSILKRAIEDRKISVQFYNPKDFTEGKERADDAPYGGGPGMVVKALPVIKAIEKAKGRKRKVKIILTSPQGKQFSNETAKEYAVNFKDIIIVAGRYEGIDSRIKEAFPMDDISVGPYVLTGGELPAMIIADTVSRQLPGILGNFDSIEENRSASEEMYTRPSEFTYKRKKYIVPEVFLSGHHARLEERRKKGDSRRS